MGCCGGGGGGGGSGGGGGGLGCLKSLIIQNGGVKMTQTKDYKRQTVMPCKNHNIFRHSD